MRSRTGYPRPQPFRQGEHHLAVWHRREQRLAQPEAPPGESLGVTTGAEVPALTGERQEILVRAGVAANPGEAVLQEAAGEELIHDLGDHHARSWSTGASNSARGAERWSTVGCSENIIEASWLALCDGLELALLRPPAGD